MKRFTNVDLRRIKTLKTWSFERGKEAALKEIAILREFADDLYVGPPVLIGAGNTELFVRDVLELDVRDNLKHFEQWTQESLDLQSDLEL